MQKKTTPFRRDAKAQAPHEAELPSLDHQLANSCKQKPDITATLLGLHVLLLPHDRLHDCVLT